MKALIYLFIYFTESFCQFYNCIWLSNNILNVDLKYVNDNKQHLLLICSIILVGSHSHECIFSFSQRSQLHKWFSSLSWMHQCPILSI